MTAYGDGYPAINGQTLIITGNKGTGKTYYSKQICKKHKYRTLVLTPNEWDFNKEPDNFILIKGFKPSNKEIVEECFNLAIKLAEKNQIDAVIIDEFDLIYRTNTDISDVGTDLIVRQRHFGKDGLAVIGITRRLQDIPAKIYGQALYKVCFAIESPQTHRLLENIYKSFGEQVALLSQEERAFIIKKIGTPPEKKTA
ncbi:MAG: ATP-binding protein, partial [Minisyncoccales bacterium]